MSNPVEEIKKKLDIVEYIGSFITLKKTGRNFKAVCPFHNENTGSFKVDSERESFYCFGCNAHGDVIDYIRKTKSLTFPAALEYLGIDNGKPYKPDPLQVKKEELYRLIHRRLAVRADSSQRHSPRAAHPAPLSCDLRGYHGTVNRKRRESP